MPENPSLDLITTIHEGFTPTLLQHAQQADNAQHENTEAEQQLDTARTKISESHARLQNTTAEVQQTQQRLQAARANLGDAIARDVRIEKVDKTLYNLILSSPLASENIHSVISQTQQAWTSLTERFIPGNPVLYEELTNDWFLAGRIADQDVIDVWPPQLKPNTLQNWYGGSLALRLTHAFTGRPKDKSTWTPYDDLVVIMSSQGKVPLLDVEHPTFERLEEIASNEHSLTIGTEAINTRLERLDPRRQLIAATTLTAAGLETTYEPESRHKEQATISIVGAVTLMAAGAYTDDSLQLNRSGLVALIRTLGLDRELLEERMRSEYTTIRTGNASLYNIQLACLGEHNLSHILDAIFQTNEQS